MKIQLLLLTALATAGCSTLPSQPPPFDRIRLGMTESEAIAQLGETPLTYAMQAGYTSRCWLFNQPDQPFLHRCLLFDPHHRLIDVAGDGVGDDLPPLGSGAATR